MSTYHFRSLSPMKIGARLLSLAIAVPFALLLAGIASAQTPGTFTSTGAMLLARSGGFGDVPPGATATLPHHVLGDRGLADLDAELEDLTMDSGRSPERVGGVHLLN